VPWKHSRKPVEIGWIFCHSTAFFVANQNSIDMINNNNPIFRGMYGQIGGQLVFRNYNGRQYISKFPQKADPSKQSEAQRATRSRFKSASGYAKECMLNPERKEYYLEIAKRLNLPNAYTAAVKEFMSNGPQIH
jgi:hypothetical protein